MRRFLFDFFWLELIATPPEKNQNGQQRSFFRSITRVILLISDNGFPARDPVPYSRAGRPLFPVLSCEGCGLSFHGLATMRGAVMSEVGGVISDQ